MSEPRVVKTQYAYHEFDPQTGEWWCRGGEHPTQERAASKREDFIHNHDKRQRFPPAKVVKITTTEEDVITWPSEPLCKKKKK